MSGRGPLQRAIRRPHIASLKSAMSSPPLGVAASCTYSSLLLAGTTLLCWWYLRCRQCNSSVVTVCSSPLSFSRCMCFSSSSSCIRLFLCTLLIACLLSAPALPALQPDLHTLAPALPLTAAASSSAASPAVASPAAFVKWLRFGL